MKKLSAFLALTVTVLVAVSLFSGCSTYNYGTTNEQTYYENPEWAPEYYPGTRYYYFPDIECYYDLATREYIFLNRGQWFFTPTLLGFYNDFDPMYGFVIIINTRIYQPWMHHQYYISHYPRYYYRDYYDYSNIPYVRGFNENAKSAVYWPENQRERARDWNDNNIRENRRFKYSPSDRQMQVNTTNRINNQRTTGVTSSRTSGTSGRTNDETNTQPRNTNTTVPRGTTTRTATTENTNTRNATTDNATNQNVNRSSTTTTSRTANTQTQTDTPVRQSGTVTRSGGRTANTNYYGKPIGQPVRVERQMRSTTPETKTEEGTTTGTPATTRSSETPTRSSR